MMKISEVFIPGNPVPASRPRVTRWGTYFLPRYQKWKEDAEALLWDPERLPAPGLYHVVLEFIVARPRTSKLQRPVGDVDNYAKAVLDVLTRTNYWPDDADVTALNITKRFAAPDEAPGARAVITGPLK